jgi:steroid delta-isomerase
MTHKDRFIKFLKAYEAKEISVIEEMLDPHVRLKDWNISVKGKEAALRETAKNFADARSLKIDVLSVFENDHTVAGEIHITVDETIHLYVVDILSFNDTGLVISSRSYIGREDDDIF